MLTSFPQVISKHQNYLKLCNLSITYLEEGSNVKLIIKVIILLLEVGVIRFAFDAHSNLIYYIVVNQDHVIIIPPCEFMFLLLKCCYKGLYRRLGRKKQYMYRNWKLGIQCGPVMQMGAIRVLSVSLEISKRGGV